MLANLKIICQFQAHSVHQNSFDIFWAEIYRGRLLTLITGISSRLLCIRFSADFTMYWFPVCHFRCMKPLVIWIWNQNIAISTIVWDEVPYKGFSPKRGSAPSCRLCPVLYNPVLDVSIFYSSLILNVTLRYSKSYLPCS
jgi:hypothetical protein